MSVFKGVGRLAVFTIFFGLIAFGLPAHAHASASLYLSPPSGTFTLDSTFTVSIYVNTGGQAINAVEANLNFPADKLQVVSPTTGKSLIQVWVSQPSYSNLDGTLTFRGTIPTPGINTDSGLISTVTFRVKNIGTAAVKILDTSRVLLNDGHGTDVLGETTDGIYYLTLPPPEGPVVISRTNPDQEKWYPTKSVSFEWSAPPDIQGYSYVLNQDPSLNPDDISEGTQTQVAYNNLPDGVYYFHIKALRQGSWGGVTDYIARVDNTPPATFALDFSPGNRTSNHRPIIDFQTTDAASGIDHYEIKIIPLNAPDALTEASNKPFFIEAESPYSRILDLGDYDVVVRAFDEAGNYYQAESRLTITKPFFDVVSGEGLNVFSFNIPWFYLGMLAMLLFVILVYLGRLAWMKHKEVRHYLTKGVMGHPSISQKLKTLVEKQKEYGLRILLLLLFIPMLMQIAHAQSLGVNPGENQPLEPPVVTLFAKSISNDEIAYIGGRAAAPDAQVIIYLQDIDHGTTLNRSVATDKDGAWFYSFPDFLATGHYVIWTQLKVADEISPPSSRLDLMVAPTAIQFGSYHLSYEDFYFVLMVFFALLLLLLALFTIYHTYHHRAKSKRVGAAINDAEESIRRGFALLRKDLTDELTTIRKAKLTKELSVEEKMREEKLVKDIEEISDYISKEIWALEQAEA